VVLINLGAPMLAWLNNLVESGPERAEREWGTAAKTSPARFFLRNTWHKEQPCGTTAARSAEVRLNRPPADGKTIVFVEVKTPGLRRP